MEKKVTIIGSGFGGVYTARALMRRGFSVSLIGCDGYFTFTPLLHEVATGMLCESDVRFPIQSFLRRPGLEIISGGARAIDFEKKQIELNDGKILEYKTLVIATGARSRLEVVRGADNAVCLKTIRDAITIREKVSSLITGGKSPLEFNVIGGGFTGLELACELHQLVSKKAKCDLRLHIFERGAMPLAESDSRLSRYISKRLEESGIDFHSDFIIDEITPDGIFGHGRMFKSDMTILTAGVKPNTELVAAPFKDEKNNIIVTKNLNLEKYPEVFALGDIITIKDSVKPAMLAQLAVQQASVVARNIILQPSTLRSVSATPYGCFGFFGDMGCGWANFWCANRWAFSVVYMAYGLFV